MSHRTRIKICGLTRVEDVQAAANAGADAIGFVFYDKSPRHVGAAQARDLIVHLSPFITPVGLFVNASADEVSQILEIAPISLLQFHGDESVAECHEIAERVGRPFLRALRVKADMQPADLIEYDRQYRSSSKWFAGLLLDAFVEGYGGGGKVFDWSLIPKDIAPRLVLSGGLSVQNATEAVRRVRPWAVDVSSGVEAAKGIKDQAKIESFIGAVRAADTADCR
ncbi:phosphoribosylanthranilate isomerase [Paucimonas lemoignei]|uniref:N-(5'-phosphoribosyl)anthranilate isomerase n=2 Tax=Paucimonas lemoignei TaxID=29443 RepID=A0A4R3I1Y5_PAULE|nr:phosphoribosylanthranilate isomerase [Paucimonas lemoignei]